MTDNWYLWAAVVLGVLGLAAAYFSFGGADQSKSQRLVSFLVAGPFGPAVRNYLARRGGLKRHEVLAIAVATMLFVGLIVFTLLTGFGVRRGS